MRNSLCLAGAFAVGLATAFMPTSWALADTATRIMTVSGTGQAAGVPNQAQLSAGVTTTAAKADAALAQNSRQMNTVFAVLTRIGVPEKNIQTSNFSVQPQYEPFNERSSGIPRIVGYQVSNQVNVTLDDVKKLGPALDALVSAGANQINSISFSIREPEQLLTMARTAAVADAIKRAQTYAKAANVVLGPIVSVSEESSEAQPPMPRMTLMAAKAVPTPTAPGEQSVTVNISVVFEIK